MAPPELAADAPILDVLQPVLVNRFPALGTKTNRARWTDRGARFLDPRIFQKPLLAQPRLDRDAGALAEAHRALMRLLFREQPALGEHFGRFLARGEAIEAVELRNAGAIDPAVRMQHVDHRQVVPLADLEIEFVVRRRHFQNAGAEFRIDPFVADDRQLRAIERTPDLLA